MGLLDQYFDPEMMAAVKSMNQLSEEDKIRARNAALGQMGFAMLANNRGQSSGQAMGNALGHGGMAFNQTYQGTLDEAKQNQMQQFQMAGSLQKMQQEQAKRQRIMEFRNGLPEQDRGIFDMAPDKYIENMPRFQKQQLVEVADPNEPLRTQKQWMRPGETSGVVAGNGPMPEILDPRVQGAKQRIAAAGAARTHINMPPMESEEQKALGKDLAEQYSTTQKTAMSSSGLINKLNRAEQLMQGINTGKLAPAATEVASLAESLGIKLDPKLPQKQAFSALSNELALRAKNAGGENLMPGAMSEADRVFLQQMSPSMSNTPEGNRLIIETNKRLAKRDIEIAKMARDYRNKNRTLNGFAEELSSFSENNPLFSDIAPKGNSGAPNGGFKIIGVR